MKKGETKITYMYHSGFFVETKNYILVFDYITNSYIDNISLMNLFIGNKKEVFVFVTHGHRDHFDPIILTWTEYNNKIKYIISDDISINIDNKNIYYINKYNSLKFDNIIIKTYGTTDRGLSYLVNLDNLNIYHSGDLNWWHWKNDDKNTQIKEEMDYKKEINIIEEKNIDVAFVPVDPRLDENYYLGGKYFAQTIKPKLLIPMHFEDKIEISNKFAKKIENLNSTVWEINKPLDEYLFRKKYT
ncbi:MBL fold metallo-hydrolase [Clostridium sp. D2Q-14]|uniref:MBL fold metallo-hydrolase n=1 Tax=Anaeromonas gelatinilytica TaxID=2683194 RepID=UPI00193BF223|nr:MBL fold metallo-hydrolase [Anaeromonas gelatinilytica]MBS4536553.1 MBL fold metallo-hydrolase [Anaeromonas gelatinilytica]